ncbi:MAG: hypothetical protein HYX51_10515 [Chloroflexi bacterium]|nr:hypothetical protein [Chloroflexota bacterium]
MDSFEISPEGHRIAAGIDLKPADDLLVTEHDRSEMWAAGPSTYRTADIAAVDVTRSTAPIRRIPRVETIAPGTLLGGRALKLQVARSHEFAIEAPLLRLHVPRMAGCSAAYKRTSSAGSEAKFQFSIAGIGGSATISVSREEVLGVRAKNACIGLFIPSTLRVSIGNVLYDGRPTPITGILTDIIAAENSVVFRPLGPDSDACGVPISALAGIAASSSVARTHHADLRALAADSPAQSWSYKLSSKSSLGTDISPKLGPLADYLSVQLTTTHTDEETLEIAYELGPSAEYYAYQPQGALSMELCWTFATASPPAVP